MIQFIMKNREFWFFLFFLGVSLFNWPFLDMFGMSLMYYFPIVWLLFIFVVSMAIRVSDREDRVRND